ncbi:hypothetical protein [Nonomuraea typhae]|uniref:hypothetical protein n=1 Tax=Nonomuraea typhae TaxID=2603600 RepID=UPI0012F8F07D|nr:hypothetical protein [Nonomuraea typhae]
MEEQHVVLREWPVDGGPGGWVAPVGDPLDHWVVAVIHAVYEAPDGRARGEDPWGKPIPQGTYRAYLVDLDGSQTLTLDSHKRVLLHQAPPIGHWHIKAVDDDYLKRIEPHRVDRAGEGA